MKFGKTELIRRISDVVRNGWQNVHVRDLIESLWRDPFSMRTSGFVKEGGTNALISSEVTSTEIDGVTMYGIVFTITPKIRKFDFYQFREILSYHKKYHTETISFDAEEGLHVVYYDFDDVTYEQVLKHIHNPTYDDLLELIQWVVPITFLYYDATLNEIIYFGDNRHGSWWNPWIHWTWHQTLNSVRESGLQFTDLLPDGDGSSNTHAQFGVSEGTCFHEDIYATAEAQEAPADFQVWFFIAGNKPRIHPDSINSLVVDGLLCYNSGGAAVPATDGWFVMYHIFYSNCINKPFLSVMGQAQYSKVSTATLMMNSEIQDIKEKLPHQNLLHIGTLLFQTSAAFGNSYHSRIVSQTFGVVTKWTTIGDGSPTNPVMVKNDEENPDPGKAYSTDPVTGDKGWHFPDPRLSVSGQAYFLHIEDSDISGYKQALTDEPEDTLTAYTADADYEDGEVLIKSWDTGTLLDGITVIPAGPWIFSHFMAVGGGSASKVVVRVYKRDTSGNETQIFTFTQAVTATGATEHLKVVPQNLIEKATDDRFVVKYFHLNEDVAVGLTRTMYLWVEGNTAAHYLWSRINLPIPSEGGGDQIQSDWEQDDTEAADYIKNKPDIIAVGDWIDDIAFDFNDVESGTTQTWILDVKASFAYTILSVVLQSDSTMDNVEIQIGTTPVEFTGEVTSIDVTSSVTDISAIDACSVAVDDSVKLVSSGTDGTPTLIRGKLRIQRT